MQNEMSPVGQTTGEAADASPSKPPLPEFAKKATDLQALRDSVVDAANVGGGLWVSYLFVFFIWRSPGLASIALAASMSRR